MSHVKWIGALLIALSVGSVGALVIHVEFMSDAQVVGSTAAVVEPSRETVEQRIRSADRAADRSATQGMRDDCAALQKLGASDPACAHLNIHH